MPEKETAYQYLSEKLSFPSWFGRNLDALYDMLSAETEVPTRLVICRRGELERLLGGYGTLLLETMEEAAQTNPNLQLVYGEE